MKKGTRGFVVPQEVVDRYAAGESANTLAPLCDVSSDTFIDALKRQGVSVRAPGRVRGMGRWRQPDPSIREGDKFVAICPVCERKRLLDRNPRGQRNQPCPDCRKKETGGRKDRLILDQATIQRYLDGASAQQLAKEMGHTAAAVIKALHRQRVPVRTLQAAMEHVSAAVIAKEMKIFQLLAHHGQEPSTAPMQNKPFRYSTKQWNVWRKAVLARDDNACVLCGWDSPTGAGLAAHHILPKQRYTQLLFSVRNGVTLCVPCHSLVNQHEEDFQKQFAEYITRL